MELLKNQNYSNKAVVNMVLDAEERTYTQDLRVLNIIKMNDHLGYSIVKGLTDTYTVSYMKKDDTTFVYECSCPHNTYRGLPCKHMFKVGKELNKRGINTKIVSVLMEKGQKEKEINSDTISLVDLDGYFIRHNIPLNTLAKDLRDYEGATLKGGVVYTHRINSGYDEVALDCEDEPMYIDDSLKEDSNTIGTNYNIEDKSKVDTITLVIKGTKVTISGTNLTVNVE